MIYPSLSAPLQLFTICCLSALLLCSPAVAQTPPGGKPAADNSPFVTLVSTGGQTIEAEIISASEDTILIRRRDKQEFRFSPSMLDAKSQQLVKNWIADQIVAKSLEIRPRERTLRTEKSSNNLHAEEKKLNVIEFVVSNKSQIPINNVTIEFVVFVDVEDYTDPTKTQRLKGKLTFNNIPARGEVTLSSEPIPIRETKVHSNIFVIGSKKRGLKDEIKGYVYRAIYNKAQIAIDASPKRLLREDHF